MDEIGKLRAAATEAAARVELAMRARSMNTDIAFMMLYEIAGLDEDHALALIAADEFLFVDQLSAAVADIRARRSE
jgi:hypothetical protein